MTLDQSDLTELLDALRAGGGIDVVRKGVELVLQALIDTEAEATIGARHYERNDTRTAWRNGTRDRTLSTKAGDVELKIPKLRSGSFFPQVLERRRRIDRATYAVVMEAYVHGVSTRKVDDLVQALGLESGISKSEVSRICAGLDEELTGFRERSLAHVEFPYVFLDATYVKGRVNHQVVSRAVVVATGQAPNLAELTRAWSVPTRVSRSLHTIPCIYLGSSALQRMNKSMTRFSRGRQDALLVTCCER